MNPRGLAMEVEEVDKKKRTKVLLKFKIIISKMMKMKNNQVLLLHSLNNNNNLDFNKIRSLIKTLRIDLFKTNTRKVLISLINFLLKEINPLILSSRDRFLNKCNSHKFQSVNNSP